MLGGKLSAPWGVRTTVAITALGAFALWAALSAAPAAAAACQGANAQPGKVSAQQAEKAVICLVNDMRAKQRRKKLKPNAGLRKMARSHTRGMIARNRIDHDGFRQRSRRYQRGCRRAQLVENVGEARTPRAVVQMWARSRIHRANLLNRRIRQIGVGAAQHGRNFVFTLEGGFCRK